MIDLADLYYAFREEFPIFMQINRAGPMSFVPFSVEGDEGEQVSTISMPRIVFGTKDTSLQVAFQNDRLTVLWNRITPLLSPPSYPGFVMVVEHFFRALSTLQQWISERHLPAILPRVGEVAYVDAFALDVPGHERRRIADVINFISPQVLFPMIAVEHNWTELLKDGLEGFLQAEIQAPRLLADGTAAIGFDTTTVFNPGDTWDDARANFDKAHQAAIEVFERVVNPKSLAILA